MFSLIRMHSMEGDPFGYLNNQYVYPIPTTVPTEAPTVIVTAFPTRAARNAVTAATPTLVVPTAVTVSSIESWLSASNWPAQYYPQLRYIINRESRGIPTATNPYSGARGLMQIHPVNINFLASNGYSWAQMYNPVDNLNAAYKLFLLSGWSPWACC